MGANDREADGVTTWKDFVHKYSIVRKEGKETDYWLNLIADTNEDLKPKMNELINEGQELIKIVSTIIYNTQKNNEIKNKEKADSIKVQSK
jgi:four helix bundle protein